MGRRTPPSPPRPRQPRIPPRPPAEWDAEVADALSVLGRPGAAPGPEAGERRVVNALTTLMHHPALAKAFLTFNQHLLFASTLSDRVRELLILRIGWLRQAEYEWAQHVLLGREAGLSEAEIERVKLGPDGPGWSPFDATLLRAVDELHTDACIGDATWQALAEQLDRRQLMDLVFTVGSYDLLAMVFNSFGLELDPGLVGFAEES